MLHEWLGWELRPALEHTGPAVVFDALADEAESRYCADTTALALRALARTNGTKIIRMLYSILDHLTVWGSPEIARSTSETTIGLGDLHGVLRPDARRQLELRPDVLQRSSSTQARRLGPNDWEPVTVWITGGCPDYHDVAQVYQVLAHAIWTGLGEVRRDPARWGETGPLRCALVLDQSRATGTGEALDDALSNPARADGNTPASCIIEALELSPKEALLTTGADHILILGAGPETSEVTGARIGEHAIRIPFFAHRAISCRPAPTP